MLPEFCFLGADHVTKPLGIKLSGNIHLWDPENSLLQNLKDVLEIDFPARTILEESVSLIIASIVYLMLIIKFKCFSQENKAEKEKKLEECCTTELLVTSATGISGLVNSPLSRCSNRSFIHDLQQGSG